jgi:hypothetical protein
MIRRGFAPFSTGVKKSCRYKARTNNRTYT